MNELIEISKEITRLWHEGCGDPYKELKVMGYKQEDIRTVVFILKEGNQNMMEGRIKRDNKWSSFS